MTPDNLLALLTSPPRALHMESDDADEVTSWVARRDGNHSRVVHGTGPYGFRLARIEAPCVQLAWAGARLAHALRACFRQPTFHIPLEGSQHYVYGRQRIEVDVGKVVFMAPGTEVTRHTAGDLVLAIELDASRLKSEVRSRRGTDLVEWPLVPQLLDLSEPQWIELVAAISGLGHARLPGASASRRAHGERRLLSALAGALTQSASSSISPVSAQRLSSLEDWIDAHLGEAITLGRLCEVGQVGERSLQLAFQARRGMSPMRFVAERRLAAAQRRLSNPRAGEGVTAIATSLGFTHLGRFSVAYRKAFGESPTQTVARGRRRAAGAASTAA
jgi:AraC-like DNA-binding protein